MEFRRSSLGGQYISFRDTVYSRLARIMHGKTNTGLNGMGPKYYTIKVIITHFCFNR